MRKYEGVFIFKPNLEEEARVKAFERIIEPIKNDGEVTEIAEWGMRRLAYEINYNKEGFYYIVSFNGTPEIVAEVERRSRIADSVLRFMVTRVEK